MSESEEKIPVCWHYRIFKSQAFIGYLNRVPKISKELYPSKPITARTACYFCKHCNWRLIKDGINMHCSTFKKFTGPWNFGHAIHMMWLLWKLFPVWFYMSYTGVPDFLKICQKMVCWKEINSLSLWYCELFVTACIIISLNVVWYLVQLGWVSIGCPHQYDNTSWYTQIPINLSSVASQASATPANHTSATAAKCCWRRRSGEC